MQEAIKGELDDFLGYPKFQQIPSDNSRNGHTTKTVQTDTEPMDITVPRDRKSYFEPKPIRKRKTVLDDLEDRIVVLDTKRMTTSDIQDIPGDMFGIEISSSLLSRITGRVLPRLKV